MASAADLTIQLAKLEERVDNHIKFFWVVVAAGFGWLGIITGLLIHTNINVTKVSTAQANAPAQIVAGLLDERSGSAEDEASKLAAVSTILRRAKSGAKVSGPLLSEIYSKISQSQVAYRELPQVWSATSALITYKSQISYATARGIRAGSQCESGMNGSGWRFTNCDVTLDVIATHITNIYSNGIPAPFTFINCTIRYNGGPIPTTKLTFYDSVFVFNVPSVPDRAGMNVLAQLTEADFDEPVTISQS